TRIGQPEPPGTSFSITATRPAVVSADGFTVASVPRNQSASPAAGASAIGATSRMPVSVMSCPLRIAGAFIDTKPGLPGGTRPSLARGDISCPGAPKSIGPAGPGCGYWGGGSGAFTG